MSGEGGEEANDDIVAQAFLRQGLSLVTEHRIGKRVGTHGDTLAAGARRDLLRTRDWLLLHQIPVPPFCEATVYSGIKFTMSV